jgi:aspartate/methionine/tyrosine aminotransferase
VDVGEDADDFVPRALKATGVLAVPGGGFGAVAVPPRLNPP